MTFLYPWCFLLLPLIILTAFYMARRRRPAISFPSADVVKRSGAVRKLRLTLFEFILLTALVILTAALARPVTEKEKIILPGEGVDIILALDMSGSMAAYDLPDGGFSSQKIIDDIREKRLENRLETAKKEIQRFIASRPDDRIGLIGFAGQAYSFVPPTTDHRLLTARLAELEPGDLGDATGIASPIGTGVKQLKDAPSPRRVLVLFTDGTNTAINRVSPQDAARAAKELNVLIHTVGIGSENSIYIDRGGRLSSYPNSLDSKLLQEIAAITGGNYYPAADAKGMKNTMDEINQLEKTGDDRREITAYREFAPYAALAAAVLLLSALIFSAIGRTTLP